MTLHKLLVRIATLRTPVVGYRIHYDKRDACGVLECICPDFGEPPIRDGLEALRLAHAFAVVTAEERVAGGPRFCNIRVWAEGESTMHLHVIGECLVPFGPSRFLDGNNPT